MKTFLQFQEDIRYRDPSARGGFDPRFDRPGRPYLGRGPNRWQIPDRSPTLGMDKMARTQYNAKLKSSVKSGLPEQMTAPKLMNKNMLDLRTTQEKQKEIDIPAKLLPYNPKIGDQYKTR